MNTNLQITFVQNARLVIFNHSLLEMNLFNQVTVSIVKPFGLGLKEPFKKLFYKWPPLRFGAWHTQSQRPTLIGRQCATRRIAHLILSTGLTRSTRCSNSLQLSVLGADDTLSAYDIVLYLHFGGTPSFDQPADLVFLVRRQVFKCNRELAYDGFVGFSFRFN